MTRSLTKRREWILDSLKVRKFWTIAKRKRQQSGRTKLNNGKLPNKLEKEDKKCRNEQQELFSFESDIMVLFACLCVSNEIVFFVLPAPYSNDHAQIASVNRAVCLFGSLETSRYLTDLWSSHEWVKICWKLLPNPSMVVLTSWLNVTKNLFSSKYQIWESTRRRTFCLFQLFFVRLRNFLSPLFLCVWFFGALHVLLADGWFGGTGFRRRTQNKNRNFQIFWNGKLIEMEFVPRNLYGPSENSSESSQNAIQQHHL